MAELMSASEARWRIGDHEVSCKIDGSKDEGSFHFSGVTIPFRVLDSQHVEISGKRHRFYVIHDHDSTTVWIDGHTYRLQRAQRAMPSQGPSGPATGEVHALMPGKLVGLSVAPGDVVAAKQTVAIMESMKMETALFAPVAGRVEDIRFKVGDVIDMGDVLMVIKSTETTDDI